MQTKLLTKPIPYTFIRDGYYYFTRRVPTDLQGYYRYPRIVQGLQTSSSREARVLANLEAAKLEAYWSKMRLKRSRSQYKVGQTQGRGQDERHTSQTRKPPQTNVRALLSI